MKITNTNLHNRHQIRPPRPSLIFQIGTRLFLLAPLLLGLGCAKTVRSYNQFSADSSHSVDEWSPPAAKHELLGHKTEELIERGYIYLSQGNESLATLHFLAALGKNPKSAAAYAGLGEVDTRKNLLDTALNHYSLAIKFEAKNRVALLGLGRLHRKIEDLEKSVQYLEEANAAYPRNCDIVSELALTNDFMAQREKAESLYRQAIALDGRRGANHNNLGYNLLLQGRYTEAAQAFRQTITLEPDNKRARNNLATAYILAGQVEEAMPFMDKTVGQAAAHNNLGYIYMTCGEWDKAELEFREAMAIKPSYYKLANQNLDLLQKKRVAQKSQPQPTPNP